MIKYLILTVMLVFTAACATLFDGTRQKIKVEAVNISDNKILKGVRCTVTDEMESIYMLAENPGIIRVKKGQGALQFDCKKNGYIQKNAIASESFNGTAFFNVFTGGVGFMVDAVTGAMLDYPSHVIIRMEEE
jgi:hypothetical protein